MNFKHVDQRISVIYGTKINLLDDNMIKSAVLTRGTYYKYC